MSIARRARGRPVAIAWVLLGAVAALSPGSAKARPEAPGLFCETYPEAGECLGRVVECRQCHTSTFPAAWNPFGLAVLGNLSPDTPYEEALPAALAAIEGDDSDQDGIPNIEEIRGGTFPGDDTSGFRPPADPEGAENPIYDVGNYDLAFALRRVSVLYCGQSPTFEELASFRDRASDPRALRRRLHDVLSACLDSSYWRDEGLPRLADKRIRPMFVAGAESQVFVSRLRLVIGDYDYDYRLWSYVLTGDRDARDLLLARYHVIRDERGALQTVEGEIDKPDPMALAGGQPLPAEVRAGMITTQWFLAINTMFSGLPRTTAAQAYRSYLGADISSNQGIVPVAGEPSDIDNKGVADARCAACHSTLDPLAYAFAKYDGIDQYRGLKFGTYTPERVETFLPGWSDEDQQPVILGQPVSSLREWAEVASESDAFKRNLAQMFFEHALSRGPNPDEIEAFTALWRAMPEDDYSANQLIHRLVDTDAFGVP